MEREKNREVTDNKQEAFDKRYLEMATIWAGNSIARGDRLARS